MEGLSDGNANPFESNRQPGQKTAPGGKSSSAVQKQRIRRSYAKQLRAEETEEEAGEEFLFTNTRNREISGKQKTVFGSSRQSSGTSWHERKSGSAFSEDSQADTAGGFYRNEAAAEQAVKGSKEAGASAATSRRKGMRWRSSDSLKAEAVRVKHPGTVGRTCQRGPSALQPGLEKRQHLRCRGVPGTWRGGISTMGESPVFLPMVLQPHPSSTAIQRGRWRRIDGARLPVPHRSGRSGRLMPGRKAGCLRFQSLNRSTGSGTKSWSCAKARQLS